MPMAATPRIVIVAVRMKPLTSSAGDFHESYSMGQKAIVTYIKQATGRTLKAMNIAKKVCWNQLHHFTALQHHRDSQRAPVDVLQSPWSSAHKA